jgi:putative transposase
MCFIFGQSLAIVWIKRLIKLGLRNRSVPCIVTIMNPPRRTSEHYIDFLIGTPKVCSATEAARVQPLQAVPVAHDAYTRLLHRLEPDPQTLWAEAATQVHLDDGVLVLDDSTLDKPYANAIELVTRHWSGKHHAVVKGINLVSLLWTDGDRHIPCDYRIYDKADGLTKNDHFRHLLTEAKQRGFRPGCVAFDGWYASLDNLKLIREFGWRWLTRFKVNRLVNKDRQGIKAIQDTEIAATGTIVWLSGYGLVKVFKIVAPHGDISYWATNDLEMDELTRLKYSEWSWKIEEYHRGIKQYTEVERCQARAARAQRNHIGMALRAFLRLEVHCFRTGISWFEAKTEIVRDAVRAYLAQPRYRIEPTA